MQRFTLGQLFRRVDVGQPQVVAVADVRHHGHVAVVEAEPLAEDAAAGRLEHGHVDAGVDQHAAGALRAAAIAAVDAAIVDENPVRAGHAHALARAAEDMRDEARGGRLAVDAGDGDDGDAAIFAGGKQRVDDGLAHRTGNSHRRFQVHAEAGGGVDFDDHAPLLAQRPGDVLRHRRRCRQRPGRRSWRRRRRRPPRPDDTRSVTSMAVPPVLRLALRRMSTIAPAGGVDIGRESLIGQHGHGNGIQLDLAQHGGMVLAAAGIGVGQLDQLGHAVHAVAEDLGRLAAGGGYHPIAHDQQAIVVAGGELLDQHRLAFLPRRGIGGHDLLAGRKVGGHAAALVAVLRFDDHRHADVAGRLPRRRRRPCTGRP